MAKARVKIIHRDCDESKGDDRSLPYTSYLVTYRQEGHLKYDIATAPKKVDVFDYYWDEYRHDFVTMKQTEGRVNPKLWSPPK
jgi:hypothetical protein